MTLNDFKPQNKDFSVFLLFSAAEKWITTKWMEIDPDNLQTGTVTGSHASPEH